MTAGDHLAVQGFAEAYASGSVPSLIPAATNKPHSALLPGWRDLAARSPGEAAGIWTLSLSSGVAHLLSRATHLLERISSFRSVSFTCTCQPGPAHSDDLIFETCRQA